MGRRGRKRRITLETEYWGLLSGGMGTVEACRKVGVGRNTGFRWRRENGAIAPTRLAEDQHSGRYLSHFERQRIAALRERGHGVREIARRIERAPSIVSRELSRNRLAHDRGGYDGDLTHARARERARRPKPARLATGEMARHAEIAELFAGGISFTNPASPWQRGTNENTNGLLRQYFPKGTDLSLHPETKLRWVEERLNDRPRKILGWSTPSKILAPYLTC